MSLPTVLPTEFLPCDTDLCQEVIWDIPLTTDLCDGGYICSIAINIPAIMEYMQRKWTKCSKFNFYRSLNYFLAFRNVRKMPFIVRAIEHELFYTPHHSDFEVFRYICRTKINSISHFLLTYPDLLRNSLKLINAWTWTEDIRTTLKRLTLCSYLTRAAHSAITNEISSWNRRHVVLCEFPCVCTAFLRAVRFLVMKLKQGRDCVICRV
jgi:hypothetical protein